VIVVDNAADGPEHAALAAQLQALPQQVECIASGGNLGYAGGNNVGIRRALERGAEWVWLLNPDTEVQERTLERLVVTGKQHPEAGTLGPRLLFPDHTIQFDGGMVDDELFGAPSHLHYGRKDKTTPAEGPREVDYVNGASLMIRTQVLRTVGLLPEEYFLYFEETAFCREVAAAGWRNMVEPRARVIHHNRSRPGLPTPYYIYYMTRNRLYFAKHYYGAEPEAVLPQWDTAFLAGWRGKVAKRAPEWLPTFEEIVARAVSDARAGVTGQVPEVERWADPTQK
jgi:GT2 family glycosyltransferase